MTCFTIPNREWMTEPDASTHRVREQQAPLGVRAMEVQRVLALLGPCCDVCHGTWAGRVPCRWKVASCTRGRMPRPCHLAQRLNFERVGFSQNSPLDGLGACHIHCSYRLEHIKAGFSHFLSHPCHCQSRVQPHSEMCYHETVSASLNQSPAADPVSPSARAGNSCGSSCAHRHTSFSHWCRRQVAKRNLKHIGPVCSICRCPLSALAGVTSVA